MKNRIALLLLAAVTVGVGTLNARYAPDGKAHYRGGNWTLDAAPAPPKAPVVFKNWCPICSCPLGWPYCN